MPAEREPSRLKDLLGELGPRLGMRRPAQVGKLWARWPEVVGPEIAAQAEPTSIRDGVLRIRTASPTWATEIGYLADEIIRRVNEAMGADLVTEVKVWIGPGAIQDRRAGGTSDRLPSAPLASAGSGPRRASPEEAMQAARAAWEKRVRRSGTSSRKGRSGTPREGS